MKSNEEFAIGLDLGGTKIAVGLVNHDGDLLHHSVRPSHPSGLTPAARDAVNREVTPENHIQFVIQSMATAVSETLDLIPGVNRKQKISKLHGIGLASAGPMNVKTGHLLSPANFSGWIDVPIRDLLSSALQELHIAKPVFFQNDAIAAALGEGWVGAARNCSTFAMITLGTGVGSGVILNGRPAQSDGMGSEWGHMLLQVQGIKAGGEDFNFRTAEGLCSGTGILRRARARGYTGASVNKLADAARENDALARQVFAEASEALGCFLVNLSLGLHCQKIVIGGGLLHIQDLFLPAALELYRSLIRSKNAAFECPVEVATQGNDAGIIGAAKLAWL